MQDLCQLDSFFNSFIINKLKYLYMRFDSIYWILIQFIGLKKI